MIYITQCLCPNRHCIMAIAWEGMTIEIAEEGLKELVDELVRVTDAKCAICGRVERIYETGTTKFETMKEAKRVMAEMQEANLQTRRFMLAERN